ncbi:cupin domain-containing protein [Pimelobacter simplex]|uniref:Uncharacterized protein n=1 Tax=Nocardioides simplex TaxID=2045 RepID=A0A0C5XMU3_NOCSI|nr:cupin domain-containing protein [Pimelobacter simplex]AJR18772.1 hypothetical protein KR76_24805 [Pimelobacter simplex]MCG8149246.1 cupin domain-containing protein [Pimelobacter simplex]GEB16623.1 hypothetical protein NSI01_49380 [Pimelobacter simplex]SFM21508.1 Cupin domain-containing protein [Pimelobacter simplex]
MTALNPSLFGKVVNWDDLPQREIRPGVRRRIFATDEVLIARHELEVGMTLNPHSHEDFDQLVFIASGRCNYHVAGVAHDMRPGSFLLVPRGAEHYVEPTEGPCVNIDYFVPPRADLLAQLELDLT